MKKSHFPANNDFTGRQQGATSFTTAHDRSNSHRQNISLADNSDNEIIITSSYTTEEQPTQSHQGFQSSYSDRGSRATNQSEADYRHPKSQRQPDDLYDNYKSLNGEHADANRSDPASDYHIVKSNSKYQPPSKGSFKRKRDSGISIYPLSRANLGTQTAETLLLCNLRFTKRDSAIAITQTRQTKQLNVFILLFMLFNLAFEFFCSPSSPSSCFSNYVLLSILASDTRFVSLK